jgi:ankyrin repeat protein
LDTKVNRLSDGIKDMQFRQLNQEWQAILDWFTPVDYGTLQSHYFGKTQQGTGQWFLESTEYREWLDADGKTLLCLGIPGAGKTILSSIVINNLQTRFSDNTKIGVAYIYYDFQRKNEQGIDDILASVLKQLTQCLSSLPDSIKSLYKQHNTRRTRPSRDEILGLLQSVLPIYSRVFLVVDALDECRASDGCRKRFVSELFNLQIKFGINIFATSRHIPEIVNHFKASFSKEIEIRAKPEDVTRYLEDRIGNLPSCVQQNRQLQEDITTGISEAVDGMYVLIISKAAQQLTTCRFLLANLYLELLVDKLSPNDVRSAIDTFRKQSQGSSEHQRSQALDRAYEQVMKRIKEQMPGMRTLAMKALLWITWAKRQLTMSELQHALATKTGKSEFDHGDLTPIEDIVSVCAGLVTVDEESGIIRLVHYTTHQYLERSWDSWFPHATVEIATKPNPIPTGSMTITVDERGQTAGLIDYTKREYLEWTQGSWSPNANAAIATSCLTYLLFTDFDVDFSNLDEYLQPGKYVEPPYPLLNYCVEYSAQHARLASPEPPFVIRFFSSESNIIKNWLLLAAKNGGPQAEATTEWLLERGACIDVKDSEWKTPLHHAVLNDWKRCVLLLLQREASLDPDSDNMTPFHYTVKNNNQEITQIFLDAGTPVDLTVRRRVMAKTFQNGRANYRVQSSAQNLTPKGSVTVGLTSLHLATLTGCREMTKFLLERGANPSYASDHGETPLHLALKRNLSGPQHLANLDFWVNLENRIECISGYLEDEEFLSARLRVDEVRLEIINLLLEHPGSNVNAQDITGASPLHIMSGGGSASKFMIQKLIEKGARISTRTNKGETPLHVACRAGNIDNLTILLESGADPTECDEEGANALHYAAQRGHGETIRTILAHMPEGTREAFINSKDKHGKNALHHLFKNFKRIRRVDSLKSLLELSSGVNELDQAGMSPTAIFLKGSALFQSDEDPEVLRLLFGHGADPSFETKEGLNLVHLAAKSGRASTALLRILANQKVDVRARDKQGRTAFHHGAISGNLAKEALYCLRDEFQLSTQLLDEQGKTPLAYAIEKDQEYHHPYTFNPKRWARIQTLLRE